MKKCFFIIILFFYLLCSCSDQIDRIDEDEYIRMIESLEDTNAPLYVTLHDIEDVITEAKANLIVKCKVISRTDPVVFDPFGSFTTGILTSDDVPETEKVKAADYITTPYELELSEVYLGNADSGGTIPFYAPYGVINGYSCKLAGHPVLHVGSEYIMFLRVDNIGGTLVYYLAHPMYSVFDVNSITSSAISAVNESVDSRSAIYAEYTDASDLINEIKNLVANHYYDVSMDIIDIHSGNTN